MPILSLALLLLALVALTAGLIRFIHSEWIADQSYLDQLDQLDQ